MKYPDKFPDTDFPLIAKTWRLEGMHFSDVDDDVDRFIDGARRMKGFYFHDTGDSYLLKDEYWWKKKWISQTT